MMGTHDTNGTHDIKDEEPGASSNEKSIKSSQLCMIGERKHSYDMVVGNGESIQSCLY